VFVVEDDRARLRNVEPGRRNRLEVEILEGLSAGERIVEHPGNRLEDGARVVPRD
jgi:HlyD family secretion protein